MIVSQRPRRIESVHSGSSIPRAQESPGYRIAFSRRETRKTCDIPATISPPHLATPRGRTKTRTLSIYPTQQAKAEDCIPCSGMALRVLQVPLSATLPISDLFSMASFGLRPANLAVIVECPPNSSFLGRRTSLPMCFDTFDCKNLQSCQKRGLVLTIPLCSQGLPIWET